MLCMNQVRVQQCNLSSALTPAMSDGHITVTCKAFMNDGHGFGDLIRPQDMYLVELRLMSDWVLKRST